MLEHVVEVVALHNHVVEFQKTQTLFHALFVALGGQHTVDAEACAHLTQQLDVVEVEQPVGVVEHHRFAFAKFNEALHLTFEALGVVGDVLFGQHLSHVGSAGWVTDHGGAAANQRDWAVACHLQTLHQGQRHKVSGGQAVGGAVKADVKGCFSCVDQFLDFFFVGDLSNQTTANQFFIQCHLYFLHILLRSLLLKIQKALRFFLRLYTGPKAEGESNALPPLFTASSRKAASAGTQPYSIESKAGYPNLLTQIKRPRLLRKNFLFGQQLGEVFTTFGLTSFHQPEAL